MVIQAVFMIENREDADEIIERLKQIVSSPSFKSCFIDLDGEKTTVIPYDRTKKTKWQKEKTEYDTRGS